MTATQKTWALYEEGYKQDEFVGTKAEAKAAAKAAVSRSNYPDAVGTIWVGWMIRCGETGEEVEGRVALHPEEPACTSASGHDWRSPHKLVGGMRENPGVTANGGGVIAREVCSCCGKYRITNTWAQDPETGRQGLESVVYEDADDDSAAWAAAQS